METRDSSSRTAIRLRGAGTAGFISTLSSIGCWVNSAANPELIADVWGSTCSLSATSMRARA